MAQPFTGFLAPVNWGPYDGTLSSFYSTTYRGNWVPPGGPGDGSEGTGSHQGVDIIADTKGALNEHTEVRAIYDGVIWRETVYGASDGGFGNSLVLVHVGIPDAGPTGVIFSAYEHLSSIALNPKTGKKWEPCDTVSKGDVLGNVGDTGRGAFGLHLHFQIDQDYTDQDHPFSLSFNGRSENTVDSDGLVAGHTVNPVTFVNSHLVPLYSQLTDDSGDIHLPPNVTGVEVGRFTVGTQTHQVDGTDIQITVRETSGFPGCYNNQSLYIDITDSADISSGFSLVAWANLDAPTYGDSQYGTYVLPLMPQGAHTDFASGQTYYVFVHSQCSGGRADIKSDAAGQHFFGYVK